MERTLLSTVRELYSLNDDNLAERVVLNNDVQWCLGKLKDILEVIGDMTVDRLRELAQADREGRCVVLPEGGCEDKDGENALKSAMHTCFYHNNPVTRFIADAVAEKLTRQEARAALRREQDG